MQYQMKRRMFLYNKTFLYYITTWLQLYDTEVGEDVTPNLS